MKNNNQEYYKFLGKLYDTLLNDEIIKSDAKSNDLKEKIFALEKYLDKLEITQKMASDNKRYINMLKKLYYDKYIIKEENIPDNYFKFLEQRYQNQGYGFVNLINPKSDKERNLRNRHIEMIIKEQKESLDNWLNYFLSDDSSYMEMWAKVWAFQGMLQIGNLNKNKDGYHKRNRTTVNPFVSIDSEVLNKCISLIQESFNKKEATNDDVKKLLEGENFSKLYGKLLANKKQIKFENTDGIWIKYNRETEESIKEKLINGQVPEYIKLYNSLQGYNTSWCTAGSRETAKNQILNGDFYVYYSKDNNGDYKIPRLAIRMEENNISEIRGIASNQNIESNMEFILEDKLKEFPDAECYKKKVSDMKKLTEIYNKHINKEILIQEELMFLYEIDSPISGFGYFKDPRIKEIIKNRNRKKDFAYIVGCNEEEIGFSPKDLERPLKYYFGDIDLDELMSAEGLELPKIIKGNLSLSRLTNAEGLKLPEIINGYLDLGDLIYIKELQLPKQVDGDIYLNQLISAEELKFPEKLGGELNLENLITAKGLILPETINGSLYLDSLTSAEDLKLPNTINGHLFLSGLTSAKGLELPKIMNGGLVLRKLTSAEGLILPEIINDNLNLGSLTSAEDLKLPNTINGCLFLNGLTNAEGLKLPKIINGRLDLDGLTSAEGLILPEIITGSLDLRSLTSLKNVVLPQKVDQGIYIYGAWSCYSLDEVKEMQIQEEHEMRK